MEVRIAVRIYGPYNAPPMSERMVVKRQTRRGGTGRTTKTAGDDKLGLNQQQEGP